MLLLSPLCLKEVSSHAMYCDLGLHIDDVTQFYGYSLLLFYNIRHEYNHVHM